MADISNTLSNICSYDIFDIYCKRILAKKILKSIPILFNVEADKQIPIDICIITHVCPVIFETQVAEILAVNGENLQKLIEDDTPTDILLDENERLAELICRLTPGKERKIICIENMKVSLYELNEEIICNHKVRLKLKFQIAITVKLSDGGLFHITLPEDEGTKFCFSSDINLPIEFNIDNIEEILEIDNSNKYFILKIEIPLRKFEGNIPPHVFEDPTLQSRIIIKNIMFDIDVGKECEYDCSTGTSVSIIVGADITDKIGIDQDILICGTLDNHKQNI